jgi:hypothetical protein
MRLIEFGGSAIANQRARRLGGPASFDGSGSRIIARADANARINLSFSARRICSAFFRAILLQSDAPARGVVEELAI